MQFSAVLTAVAIFSGLGQAAVVTSCINEALAVPPCATSCAISVASALYSCDQLDSVCQCAHSSVVDSICSSSLQSACGSATAQLAQTASQALCACAATATA